MVSPSRESEHGITSELLNSDLEQKAELISDTFHITALYNYHGTPEHALETLDEVTPSSIVFCEGDMLDPAYARWRLGLYASLADARLQIGSYGPEQDEGRDTLVSEFLLRAHSKRDDCDQNSYTLYMGLLDKNCVVLPADYLNLDGDEPVRYSFEGRKAQISDMLLELSTQNIEDIISAEEELIVDGRTDNIRRECSAVNYVLYFLSKYSREHQLGSVSVAPTDGKTQAYIVYGLAHRNSLTDRFTALGIPIETILINTGATPTDNLLDLATEFAQPATELRDKIRDHYLGILATGNSLNLIK